jgi:NitT/TauT family transport system substrate-binding protein
MNRKRILELVAAAGASAAASPVIFSAPAFAQGAPAPVRIGTFASESTGAAFYAQDQGYFAKHNIAADINVATGGAAVLAAIVGGSLDIGEADILTIAMAHDKGLPFTFIAPGELHTVKAPTLAVVVNDPNLKLGKDFNGKTLACNVARGFGSLLMDAWIDNNGGDSKTAKWVEFPFPQLSPQLQRGTIDAYIAPEPFCTVGAAAGGRIVQMDSKPITPVLLQGGWFASKDWVAKNPTVAANFAAAIRDANVWANGNAAGTAEIISKYSKVPLAVIMGMKMRGEYQTKFDPATMQPLFDAAAKYGYLSKSFPANDIIAKI